MDNKQSIRLSEDELKEIIRRIIKEMAKKTDTPIVSERKKNPFPDIKEFAKTISFANTDFLQQINEGLIQTYDFDVVKRILCRKFSLMSNQVHKESRQDANGLESYFVIITLDEMLSSNDIGDITHFMNQCGYFEFQKPRYDSGYIWLMFEPKFSKDVTDYVKKNYQYLFHATPTVYVDKILKNGLVPYNKNNIFLYPHRIYCMTGETLSQDQLTTIQNVQHERAKTPRHDNNEYTILQIDISKLPDRVHFMADPMSPSAILTSDNIPPQSIQISQKL